jgi:hypothetical protein
MSDFDPSTFTVNWAERSDSAFYSIDAGTYVPRVERVEWKQTGESSQNPGQPMAQVTFKFGEVRVSKPKKGAKKNPDTGSYSLSDLEPVTERERELRSYFTFSSDFALEQARKFLIATGVATPEELEDQMDGPTIIRLFNETEGAELAVKVTKAPPKREGVPVDELGNSNNVREYYGKDTRQFAVASQAAGSTVDAASISFGGRGRKKG